MRDRDGSGRPRNARPRDALGRPLPRDGTGVPPLPADLDPSPTAVVALAGRLLEEGLPFQAHEVLEVAWKAAPADQRRAWQGLAQLAVALTHALRRDPVVARRLVTRGLSNLDAGRLPAAARPLRDRLLGDLERSLGDRSDERR